MSRLRSLLHLATCERIVLRRGAVGSLSSVPTRRMVVVTAVALVGLVALPGLALAAIVGDDGNGVARMVLLVLVWSLAIGGISGCVRRLVDGYRWRGVDGRKVVVSNFAVGRRGIGLGRSLLNDVTRLADEAGRQLVLAVRADNAAARSLYRSVGFVETKTSGVHNSHIAMVRSAPHVGGAPDSLPSRRHVAGVLAASFGGVAMAVLATATSLSWSGRIAVVCSLWFLWSAAVVDLRTNRLPNRLLMPAAVCTGLAVVVSQTYDVVLIAAGIGAAPFLLVHLVDPSALGFGDVKFAAVAGALMATWWWPAAAVMSLATLATACAVRIYRPHGAIPMGPSLFAGTCVASFVSIGLVQNGLVL